ncbi:cytochrome P450 [Fusarium albosuccineum]|uniref:Cytochrome P450 n=1 Tax=Fusarium albosuccineum TaxID=1237068 RepID=A0A8H4LL00_9HYPO|nr:cytochrome P450 [Fusarium albosuccineum]
MHTIVVLVLAAAVLHVLLSTLVSIIRSHSRSKLSSDRGCKPGRSDQSWDLIGLGKIFGVLKAILSGRSIEYLETTWEEYGDTYTSSMLGQHVVFTRDAANIRQLLVTRWADYDAAKNLRTRIFRDLAPRAIFALDGHPWKEARNMWRALVSAKNNLFDIDAQEIHFQRLSCRILAEEIVDIQSLAMKFMNDVMTEVNFGKTIGCLDPDQSPENGKLGEHMTLVNGQLGRDGFLGPAAVFFSKKKQMEAVAHIHRFVNQMAALKLQEISEGVPAPGKPCVLDHVVDHTTDSLELRDALMTLVLGANESTGSLIATVVWVISRDYQLMSKLRQEILNTIGYNPPTMQELKGFATVNQVILEVLRMYPPVPFNARLANKDTWLPSGGGPDGTDPLLVKKGHCVVFSVFGSHRNPQNFGDDATTFRPERWDSLKVDTPGYLPFLMGPRTCLGQQFAMSVTTYFTVRLLQSFERIESQGAADFKGSVGVSMTHRDGIKVAFTPDPQNLQRRQL